MTSKQNGTDRRDFLKTSALAAAGTGLLSSFAGQAKAFAAGEDTVRVGLIGCGGRGTGAAAQALSTKGSVKLIAMADAFEDQLERSHARLQRQFRNQKGRVSVDKANRFVGFDAYKKLVAMKDIDLVVMATPPGFRPIHFEAAIKEGKHVLAEKPVATDAPGVRKFVEAVKLAKSQNLKVGIGLQRHHQNTYLETMKRLKDGAIGDIIAMRCYWNSGGVWEPRRSREQCKTEMEYQMRNWYYYNWLCGDHIVEQHIHNIDVCNWLKDAYPVKATGMGGREVRKHKRYGEIFDHHAVQFEYEDGTYAFSQCRHIRNTWVSVSEHAHGSKGSANISRANITTGKSTWRYDGARNNPYQTEHDDLFNAIRKDLPYNEGMNGAYSTMTSIMGRMATYSGKPVTWEKAINSNLDIMPEKFTWDAELKNMPNENGEYAIPVPGVTRAF
ncbi:MAG: Gfo/Idh/MocA family oxidoreductase [Planctomycetaceae bacterium]